MKRLHTVHTTLTGCAMASASASVDSKAELTALLEQWEREQQGSTQELVNILTKYVVQLKCNHQVGSTSCCLFWLVWLKDGNCMVRCNFQDLRACWERDRGVPQSGPRPFWWSTPWYEKRNTITERVIIADLNVCVFLTFPSWPLGRADPECVLGHLLKILFKNDDFMNTVRIDLWTIFMQRPTVWHLSCRWFFLSSLCSWWIAMWWPVESFPSMQQPVGSFRTSCLDWRQLWSFRKRWVIIWVHDKITGFSFFLCFLV